MDGEIMYPPKHYGVDAATGILAPLPSAKRSPTPPEQFRSQAFEDETHYTKPMLESVDTVNRAETIWNMVAAISAIFLGLGIITTSIVIPVYLVPLLTSTTTRITTSTTTTATTTTTTTTTTTSRSPYYCGGRTWPFQWMYYSGDSIYVVVDTSPCNFNAVPYYFTSMGGNGNHFLLTGHGAIYSPTANSFIVYVINKYGYNSSTLLNYAQTEGWFLNWYGIVM